MRFDCSFVRANGCCFAYSERGSRSGPAVLLLHGYSDSHRSFDLIAAHLPETWRVIALSQRGHGRTDKSHAGYAMAEMAADVIGVMDALGVEEAILVGHSMGASIATEVAALLPERVNGLALIGAFADFRNNESVAELVRTVSHFGEAVDPEFVLAFQESTFAEMIPQRFLDIIVSESLRCPAHVWRAIAAALVEYDPLRAALRSKAPALLIHGALDAFVSRHDQQRLCEAMGGAEVVTLDGVGHAPHWEQPEETARLILRFVAGAANWMN